MITDKTRKQTKFIK